MAKKYKEIKNKKLKDKLTQQEINEVNKVESFIDSEIENQWETGRVMIDYCVLTFGCDPVTLNSTSHTTERREIMFDLLYSMYEDSDWNIYRSVNGDWKFLPKRK